MKNKKQHDLEELLKNNLTDKTAIVPDLVWDKIEAELFPKKRRRGLFWLFFAGFLLVSGVLAAYFSHANSDRSGNIPISQYSDIALTKSGAKSDSSRAGQELRLTGNGKNIPANKNAENSRKETGKLTEKSSGSRNKLTLRNGKGTVFRRSARKGEDRHQAVQGNEIQIKTNELPMPEDTFRTESWIHGDGGEVAALPLRRITFQVEKSSDSLAERWVQRINESRDKKFAVAIYGGTSMYEMAVFKDYFTSGQLSRRTFESHGFEIGTGLNYKLSKKIGVYSNISFNRKNTSFNYSLAITESDYFNHVLNGELLPLETIIDNGTGNCFLVENVAAQYRIDSWLVSLGAAYELLRWKKLAVGLDLRFSANLNSSMHMEKLTVIEVQNYSNEKFNYLKIGGGLAIDYRFSDRFSAGIAPICHFQLNPDKQSFYAGNGKELVVPVVFKVYF